MTYTKTPIYSNGKHGFGYVSEEGLTYKDPQGKERIDVGTTVFTQGGPYTLTSSGSVRTPRGIYDDLKDASNTARGELDKMNTANQNAIKARTEQQIARLNSQKRYAEDTYRNANKTAYQAYLQASNPYGAQSEQIAKLGLDESGYAETSKLKLANTYQNAINNNLLARNEYMNELETARIDALYKGDIDAANALSEYAMLVYNHGIDAAERLAQQGNAAYSAAMEQDDNEWERKMYLEESKRKSEQEKWDRAIKLASMGLSNAQIANQLGISLAELNELKNRYR